MRMILKRLLISGLGLMLLSALIFSFADILIKYLSSSFSATQIAFVRFLLGGLHPLAAPLFKRNFSQGKSDENPYPERLFRNPLLLFAYSNPSP